MNFGLWQSNRSSFYVGICVEKFHKIKSKIIACISMYIGLTCLVDFDSGWCMLFYLVILRGQNNRYVCVVITFFRLHERLGYGSIDEHMTIWPYLTEILHHIIKLRCPESHMPEDSHLFQDLTNGIGLAPTCLLSQFLDSCLRYDPYPIWFDP